MKMLIKISLVAAMFGAAVEAPLAFSQPPVIEWSRTYGGDDEDIAYSVEQTADGGYILAGSTWPSTADSPDAYLVKTDSLGNMEWDHRYGGAGYEKVLSVQQTTDGGFVLAGVTCPIGEGSCDVYLIKTDSQGDTLWTRNYGRTYEDDAKDVYQTADGGYIMVGSSNLFAGALFEIYLVKTDSLGDSLCTHVYGFPDDVSGFSVQETFDGGYVVAACNPIYSGTHDIYLLKTDSLGDTIWTRTYGGIEDDDVRSVQQTTDGGYILAGWTASFGAGLDDAYVIRTDSTGDTLWTRVFGGTDYDGAHCAMQTQDSGFFIAGGARSFGEDELDAYLIRLDANGDSLWTLVYDGEGFDFVASLDLTTDGGYAIAGYTHGDYFDLPDCWLVKTGPDTSSTHAPSIEWVSHPKDFVLHPAYPNPFNASTVLTYSIPRQEKITLSIHNVLGQPIATLLNGMQAAGNHTITWNAADCASGIYFVRLESEWEARSMKLLLIK